MDAALKTRITEIIEKEPVILFMKGNPTFPQCGFSNQVVQILKAYGISFGSCDILAEPDIRQGMKEYSDWPTFPQLYIKGEFVGGCDIVREAWQSGELTELLKAAFPDQALIAPLPPSAPKNISANQAKELMNKQGVRLLDVRTSEERAIASIEGFQLLDQKLAQEMVDDWERKTPLVFICHFGGRSGQAANFFSEQGFNEVYNVSGGIDAWSKDVDPSVPRY